MRSAPFLGANCAGIVGGVISVEDPRIVQAGADAAVPLPCFFESPHSYADNLCAPAQARALRGAHVEVRSPGGVARVPLPRTLIAACKSAYLKSGRAPRPYSPQQLLHLLEKEDTPDIAPGSRVLDNAAITAAGALLARHRRSTTTSYSHSIVVRTPPPSRCPSCPLDAQLVPIKHFCTGLRWPAHKALAWLFVMHPRPADIITKRRSTWPRSLPTHLRPPYAIHAKPAAVLPPPPNTYGEHSSTPAPGPSLRAPHEDFRGRLLRNSGGSYATILHPLPAGSPPGSDLEDVALARPLRCRLLALELAALMPKSSCSSTSPSCFLDARAQCTACARHSRSCAETLCVAGVPPCLADSNISVDELVVKSINHSSRAARWCELMVGRKPGRRSGALLVEALYPKLSCG
ncbi:hypothetical protein FB451DRAFT_1408971 [Mycena latifolia]|nr:hypothetical protein FB451DRAFT_1408971 [Mycena latifolia]